MAVGSEEVSHARVKIVVLKMLSSFLSFISIPAD